MTTSGREGGGPVGAVVALATAGLSEPAAAATADFLEHYYARVEGDDLEIL